MTLKDVVRRVLDGKEKHDAQLPNCGDRRSGKPQGRSNALLILDDETKDSYQHYVRFTAIVEGFDRHLTSGRLKRC